MSNQGYVTNPNNFKATYEIEYIDDKYTWEVLWDNTDDKWELYKKKTFDNASEAMTTYAYYRMSDRIYDVKLFMHIETETGDWYEEYIEFDSSFRHTMEGMVAQEVRNRAYELEKENDNLVKENTAMVKFLKEHGVDVYKVINEEVA